MKIGKVCEKHPQLGGTRYDGGTCTGCAKATSLAWRIGHREEARQYRLEHTRLNREKVNAAASARYRANPGAWRKNQLAKLGFTPEMFAQAKESQGGRCAVCRVELETLPSKHVHADHDHETGVARGVLCHYCNVGLGAFKDKPEMLIAAAYYLMKPTLQQRGNK